MNRKERATLARSVKRLAPLGLRVLHDCATGICHVHDMYGGGKIAELTSAELDQFLNPE